MPVIYEIDEGAGLVRTSCVGEVTVREVLDHFRIIERDSHLAGRPRRPARGG